MKVNASFLAMLIRGVADLQPLNPNDSSNHVTCGESKWTSKQKTIFEELQAESGVNNVRTWFQDHVNRQSGLSENQFLSLFHKLTDLSDYEILEIFDIFDTQDIGVVQWEDFFVLVALIAARECRQTTVFLYCYGKRMFQILANPATNKVNFERFSRLGFILGITEEELLLSLKEFNINKVTMQIDVEEFILYYFSILNKFDNGEPLAVAKRSGTAYQKRILCNCVLS
jgi:hypothetical protein